jgi:nucleoside-diphosphate-sugar epimerase
MRDDDFDQLVAGCDAVLHLAAEIGKQDRMQRVNVEATRGLAHAAERAGIQAFCYTSTVSVYGSGRASEISESSPVLTVDRDIASEYWALGYVRAYGRTKLAGERAIRDAAKSVRYTILRPAVVVSLDDLISIRKWSYFKRTLAAHRHAHHIYVRDVSDAIIWALERSLRGHGAPGSVELFNLSEDESPDAHHADFLKKAYAASGDRRFKVVTAPWVGDWLHDFLRFRSLPLRNPLWRMRFSNARLRAAGYYPLYGMAVAQSRALEQLSRR